VEHRNERLAKQGKLRRSSITYFIAESKCIGSSASATDVGALLIMIRQALILAAGMGTRIREGANDIPKPLHTVLGKSLLKRTILSLADAGITRIGVVVGFRAELIVKAIEDEGEYAKRDLQIEVIDNRAYEKANGVSVLAGKPHFDTPFLLTMADHIFDSDLAKRATLADMDKADLYLCVDYRLSEVYDMEDCTKVSTGPVSTSSGTNGTGNGDYIRSISKELSEYNCVDCGVFAVSPLLFDELSAVFEARGDCSLSAGVASLAHKRRARVLDIGDCFWQDVDTQAARTRAESILATKEHPGTLPTTAAASPRNVVLNTPHS